MDYNLQDKFRTIVYDIQKHGISLRDLPEEQIYFLPGAGRLTVKAPSMFNRDFTIEAEGATIHGSSFKGQFSSPAIEGGAEAFERVFANTQSVSETIEAEKREADTARQIAAWQAAPRR